MSGSKSQQSVLERIRGGLIVSCQALPEEPLHSSYIMGRMAFAAKEGGAAGIRANTVEDITEIKKTVDLPVIGIIKKDYEDCEIYITSTMEEVDALAGCGADIIALDCTRRLRPGKRTLDDFFAQVRDRYPDQLFMADCSDYEEGMHAAEIGLDLIGTTMHGYTDYTRGAVLPNLDLMKSWYGSAGARSLLRVGYGRRSSLRPPLIRACWPRWWGPP